MSLVMVRLDCKISTHSQPSSTYSGGGASSAGEGDSYRAEIGIVLLTAPRTTKEMSQMGVISPWMRTYIQKSTSLQVTENGGALGGWGMFCPTVDSSMMGLRCESTVYMLLFANGSSFWHTLCSPKSQFNVLSELELPPNA